MSTKVYVVVQGVYSAKGVVAVYTTLQAAMDAYPDEKWHDYEGYYMNEKDWDNALSIEPFDISGPGADLLISIGT